MRKSGSARKVQQTDRQSTRTTTISAVAKQSSLFCLALGLAPKPPMPLCNLPPHHRSIVLPAVTPALLTSPKPRSSHAHNPGPPTSTKTTPHIHQPPQFSHSDLHIFNSWSRSSEYLDPRVFISMQTKDCDRGAML
ncbi:hypothetical protein KC19_6G103200 [Ceratodon purpureus]|uniref:Uncharacterized protein n=1 Tax=Ceratodon purpureus TaxID=3225 RepID=A0A8T0HGZ6_CERPU|nr:hypothetical protein KC19_6G103200 [Ceratodon purpureus]